jgi:hypothetical protein
MLLNDFYFYSHACFYASPYLIHVAAFVVDVLIECCVNMCFSFMDGVVNG